MHHYLFIIKIALKSIFADTRRAALTMLGIIIGSASIILVMSLGNGAKSLIVNSILADPTDVLSILSGGSSKSGTPYVALGLIVKTLTNEDAEAIAQISPKLMVDSHVLGNVNVVFEDKAEYLGFRAVSENYREVNSHNLTMGRFFSERENKRAERVAVLGMTAKEKIFGEGNPVGKQVKINNEIFKIVGVLEYTGSSILSNPDNKIYMPVITAQKKILNQNHVEIIRVKVAEDNLRPIMKNNIANLLRARHNIKDPKNDDFTISEMETVINTVNSITGGVNLFLALVAGVALLVGGIGITNIMLMSVKERTREIGLRKAIGAKPIDIKNQFIMEAILITVTGSILGIILSLLISLLITFIMVSSGQVWDFVIPVKTIILTFFSSVIIGVVFGIHPAKKAAHFNPIEALRYE